MQLTNTLTVYEQKNWQQTYVQLSENTEKHIRCLMKTMNMHALITLDFWFFRTFLNSVKINTKFNSRKLGSVKNLKQLS